MKYRTAVGEYNLVSGHPRPEFFLIIDDENYLQLEFSDIAHAFEIPTDVKIALSVSEVPDDNGRYIVSDEKPFFKVL